MNRIYQGKVTNVEIASPDKFSTAIWGGLTAGHQIGEPAPLFPRKDD